MTILRVPVTPRDHIRGDERAPLQLVEYGDYQCPYCAAAHVEVRRVRARFGPRLAFVFRHFPLDEIHPEALNAAQAAEFAGAHGRFWAMHDGLYENQRSLGLPLYLALAEALGLSAPDLREALARGDFLDRISADFSGGVRSGVNGTPTFFVNGRRHDGPFDAASLTAALLAAGSGEGRQARFLT